MSLISWNDETKAVTLHSNKSDKCYVYFDAYIIPVINSVTPRNIETDSITLTVDTTNGNNPITTYYYSKDNGNSYETSNSNTYTFSGLDMGTVYNFSVYVEDSVGYESEVYNLSETTDDTILLADWVISQYGGVQGNNGIYYHTSLLANSAADNSYRYAGANPNNYVCFGSDATTCPDDNLYRIIGVFNGEIRLIKSISYGNYRWSGLASNTINTWSESVFNTDTLNEIYLNSFSTIWQNKISTHNWKVGGGSYTYISYGTVQTAYNYEAGIYSSSTTYSAKIGLMYVSDYLYAAIDDYWSKSGFSVSGENYDYRSATNNDWLYLGASEWTISRNTNDSNEVFHIHSLGYVGQNGVNYNSFVARPCFYLTSSTTYVSGSGTSSDPIRIN